MKYYLTKQQYNKTVVLLKREWLEARSIIERRLENVLATLGDDALPSVAKHVISGGKRFRGFLTIITAKALGASPEDAADAAAAIELVQAASLAIDDIIDKDKFRRGRRAAWIVFGIEKTVLSSLILIPIAQRIVERLGFTAIIHVIRAWEQTVRGEVMDSVLATRLPASSYMRLVEMKTAELFKLSTVLGALSAGRSDKETVEAAGRYGRLIGVSYQLADDIADYTIHKRLGRKLDPGEVLFEKWARSLNPNDPVGAAAKRLAEVVEDAVEAAGRLPVVSEEYKMLLRLIPPFMVKKLLEESGVDPNPIVRLPI